MTQTPPTNITRNRFRQRLKASFALKDLSYNHAERELELGNRTLIQWVTGRQYPNTDLLMRVAWYLDLCPAYLGGFSNIKLPWPDHSEDQNLQTVQDFLEKTR